MRFESRMREGDGWQLRHVAGASSTARAVTWLEPAGVELRIRRHRRYPTGITTGHLYAPGAEFTHGWAMARMRFTHPRGAHSAFWLQTTEDYIPGQAELDVVEYFGPTKGGRDFLHHAVHWRELGQLAGQFTSIEKRAGLVVDVTGWHEYGLVWGPGSYEFTIDGRTSLVIDDPRSLSGRPKVPVLSLLVSGWEEPLLDREHLGRYRAQCDHVVIESA